MQRPSFEEFMDSLSVTNRELDFFCDFARIGERVEAVEVELNMLNYLVGKDDLAAAVHRVWEHSPSAFSILPILIAVRNGDAFVLDKESIPRRIDSFFESEAGVVEYLTKTGLADVLRDRRVRNLVDYVFGVETGLDTNGRKNRGGHLMERIVAEAFDGLEVPYSEEVSSTQLEQFAALGLDKKRFDFVVETPFSVFLIEANFYNAAGSKLSATARSYTELGAKMAKTRGYEFVWITDGQGWQSARTALEEAYNSIPYIYNLSTLSHFAAMVKRLQGV